ncbi:hypothetical protein OPIT5_16295 [Opitutaceae bacterium TAV5]|nr:hypothetical protein OPIT5_16295 [Opitutaceae bacterium TAV5]
MSGIVLFLLIFLLSGLWTPEKRARTGTRKIRNPEEKKNEQE